MERLEIYGLIISILTTLVVVALYFGRLISAMKEKERESKIAQDIIKNYHSKLESRREELESKIIELNIRLDNSIERWKDSNHLLLESQAQYRTNQNENNRDLTKAVAKSFNIDPDTLSVKTKNVFVLTPFHPKFSEIYRVIKEACIVNNMAAYRSDDEFIGNNIMASIIRSILECELIIANISGRNPNVLYELGIAHSLNKPTILISENIEEVPFDMLNNRIILYRSKDELRNKLVEAIFAYKQQSSLK